MMTITLGRGKARKLTERTIVALKPDPEKSQRIWAEQLPGFHVLVHPSGRKAYYLHYSNASGRSRFKKIADIEILSLTEALELARDLKRDLVLKGEDPATTLDRGWSPSTATLKQVYDEVLKSNTVPLARQSIGHVGNLQTTLERHLLPALGHKRLEDIQGRDIRPIVNALVAEGKNGSAQSLLALIGSLYKNLQYLPGLEDVVSPVRGVRFTVQSSPPRDRVLNANELGLIWQKFGETNVVQQAAARFMLLTGQRVGQTISTTWAQVDWEEERIDWEAPAMKGKRPHAIPLTPEIREVLMLTRGLCDRYVFPQLTSRGGKPLGYQPLSEKMWAFAEKHEMKRWSSHTLRHSLATNAVGKASVHREDVSALLHHKGESITSKSYIHAHDFPAMGRTLEAHTDWLRRKGVFGTEPAQVIPMRG